MTTYLSSAYLAPIEYYSILYNEKFVFIEQYENYIKQSYRNRCVISSSNGPMVLSIPIESNGGKKCLIKDVRIAYNQNWQHLHWNAIISAYNSTPFFEYYEDDFISFYEKKYKYLFDFNEEIRLMISNLIGIGGDCCYTTDYSVILPNDHSDLRENLSPKKDWRKDGANFESIPYYQVFEDRFGFIENLSIIDLLFNMGNETLLILEKSTKKTS